MRILVFAPHNDDEVLGVGGTMAAYSSLGHEVYVCEVTRGPEKDPTDLVRKEAKEAHDILGVKETIFMDLPVVSLKEVSTIEINKRFKDVVQLLKPHIVFIPHKGDIHVDHIETSKAAMVALRPMENPQLNRIYGYETLSETEWNVPSTDKVFIPNAYSDISRYLSQKISAMSCYRSQLNEFPHPRSLASIEALARLRGSTVGYEAAEAFTVIREKSIV